jgi:hypothetical protein
MTQMSQQEVGQANIAVSERDHALDWLKGLACILMLMAHVPPIFIDSPGAWLLRWFAGMVPILFFGLAAETALIQSRRYGFKAAAVLYGWLFLLGANLVAIVLHKGRFDHFAYLEILQIIAIGSLFVMLLDRFSFKPWGYLGAAVACLVLKFAIDRWGHGVEWPVALVVPSEKIAYTPEGDARFFPGFPLVAWLWVFPFVVFVRRSSRVINGVLAALCVLGVAGALVWIEPELGLTQYGGALFGFLGGLTLERAAEVQAFFVRFLEFFDKWEMSFPYVLALMGMVSLLMWWVSFRSERVLRSARMTRLGRRPLEFLYMHFLGLAISTPVLYVVLKEDGFLMQLAPALGWVRQYLLWAVSLWVSLMLMKLLPKLPKCRWLNSFYGWAGLLVLVYLVPIIVPFGLAWWIQFGLGVLIITHFPVLTDLIRQRYPSADLDHPCSKQEG